ncbi:hypothetical protein PS051_14320 [Escherichia albertii]|uniref:hypothetical protein n=1 Tax=Escherichia albertii TaxID=208962 RepID=UPI00235FE16C|nr:hypothetical protein [Escherichia albertii]MCZ8878381.1 hypothetical protein [Escherichia albertii]WDB86747.1 hypothetical protein PS051_14320 [Escherichia albertii]
MAAFFTGVLINVILLDMKGATLSAHSHVEMGKWRCMRQQNDFLLNKSRVKVERAGLTRPYSILAVWCGVAWRNAWLFEKGKCRGRRNYF